MALAGFGFTPGLIGILAILAALDDRDGHPANLHVWRLSQAIATHHQGELSIVARNNGKAAGNGKAASNGHRAADGKVRVAIVGVGNCASSLVQGRYYYADAKDGDFVPGLMHVNLGGYHVRDIEFVAAFDVDRNKVGKDLSEAIYSEPNNTYGSPRCRTSACTVERGMTHDGLGKYLSRGHQEGARADRRHRRHPAASARST